MARRGPVRGPSHPCKGCNERYRRHGSVASVQLARRLQEAVLLIIRRSWVRAPPAPPAPPDLSCDDALLSASCDPAADALPGAGSRISELPVCRCSITGTSAPATESH